MLLAQEAEKLLICMLCGARVLRMLLHRRAVKDLLVRAAAIRPNVAVRSSSSRCIGRVRITQQQQLPEVVELVIPAAGSGADALRMYALEPLFPRGLGIREKRRAMLEAS